MELTRKKAFELSIKKWDIIVNKGWGYFKRYTPHEIEKLNSRCGLCELYFYTSNKKLRHCAKCPIRPKIKDYNDFFGCGCRQDIHPYNYWYAFTEKDDKEYAQAVLDLIKSKQ